MIKSECGNKKVMEARDKPLQQILHQKWCSNCKKRGILKIYLVMNLDGIDKLDFLSFLFFISSICLNEVIGLPI